MAARAPDPALFAAGLQPARQPPAGAGRPVEWGGRAQPAASGLQDGGAAPSRVEPRCRRAADRPRGPGRQPVGAAAWRAPRSGAGDAPWPRILRAAGGVPGVPTTNATGMSCASAGGRAEGAVARVVISPRVSGNFGWRPVVGRDQRRGAALLADAGGPVPVLPARHDFPATPWRMTTRREPALCRRVAGVDDPNVRGMCLRPRRSHSRPRGRPRQEGRGPEWAEPAAVQTLLVPFVFSAPAPLTGLRGDAFAPGEVGCSEVPVGEAVPGKVSTNFGRRLQWSM